MANSVLLSHSNNVFHCSCCHHALKLGLTPLNAQIQLYIPNIMKNKLKTDKSVSHNHNDKPEPIKLPL